MLVESTFIGFMQHLEFIDWDHFEYQYHRKYATGRLSDYVDFCWETDFDHLLAANKEGFSDVLFPDMGYTYLINLGTPFVMQLDDSHYEVKSNGFLPRHRFITCHHVTGNRLFGIKFKVSPVVFQKKVDFSEYKERIFPLAYLIDKSLLGKVKEASTFPERVSLVFDHYTDVIDKYESSLKAVSVVTGILNNCMDQKQYNFSVAGLAQESGVSKRSLQRYFEVTTGFSTKPALQTLRIRQALKHVAEDPKSFSHLNYGYHDYSHFARHLKQFVGEKHLKEFQEFVKNLRDGCRKP